MVPLTMQLALFTLIPIYHLTLTPTSVASYDLVPMASCDGKANTNGITG